MSNKNIITSWCYHLSQISQTEIHIASNVSVTLFDTGITNKRIFIWEGVKVQIFWVLEKEDDYKIEIIQNSPGSKLEIRYLLLATSGIKTKAKIHAKLQNSDTQADVKITSFAWNEWEIDIDGIIDLQSGYSDMSGHLLEENIFLGTKWKIRGVPTLLVWSDSVKASHACKIHKISDETLFYIRSRGLEKNDAVYLLLSAKIHDLFSSLHSKEHYDTLLEDVMTKLENILVAWTSWV